MSATATELLRALIPVDRTCPVCKKYVPIAKDWGILATSDIVCAACAKRDRLNNPEVYARMEGTPLRRLGVGLSHDSQPARRVKYHGTPLTPPTDVVCCRCGKQNTPETHRFSWVTVFTRRKAHWVCRQCYYAGSDVAPGQYREDRYRRIFLVTQEGWAQYVFGIRWQIPAGSCLYGSELLFKQQQQDMFDTVHNHLEYVNKYCDIYKGDIPEDEASNVAFDAAFVASTTRNKNTDFRPLLRVSIRNALWKVAEKRAKRPDETLISFEVLAETLEQNETDEDALRAKEIRIKKLLKDCEKEFGPEDWEIFLQWILGERTQEEIGRDIGRIPQTISARMKKRISACREKFGGLL